MLIRLPDPRSLLATALFAVKAAAGVWLLIAFAAVFVMTLGIDEAWVLNGLRSSLEPRVENLTTELIVTNGGPFALLNLASEFLLGSKVWVARLFSLGWLLAALYLVSRHAAPGARGRTSVLLVLAPVLAFPGVAEIGTAALGTSAGLFFMMAALSTWSHPSVSLATRIVGTGVLYGLAAASRFDLVLVGPALVLASSFRSAPDRRVDLRFDPGAIAALAIGGAIFIANQWVMSLPANAVVVANVAGSTGLSGVKFDYPKLLNAWATAATIAPLAFLVLLAVGAFWRDPVLSAASTTRRTPSFEALLAATGVVLFAGWLFRAPIPHLRYLLPSLFCFAVLGGLTLSRVAAAAASRGNLRQLLLCTLLALACMVGGIAATLRSLVMSDSDYASWEWANEMPFDYFRRFEARGEQARIAAFLRDELPAEARIYGYLPYALRYLARRPIVAVDLGFEPTDQQVRSQRFVVLSPAVGTYLYLNAGAQGWLLENAVLHKEIGRYSVYRLHDGPDSALNKLKPLRTNYEGHPASKAWFGRHWEQGAR